MPLTHFKCPDGVTRPISECLEKCPRPEGRCLRLDKLHEISYDRQWNGKASTTQLLNPVRMEYLKITKDYAIPPKSRAFAIYGTYQHRRLEIVNKKLVLQGVKTEVFNGLGCVPAFRITAAKDTNGRIMSANKFTADFTKSHNRCDILTIFFGLTGVKQLGLKKSIHCAGLHFPSWGGVIDRTRKIHILHIFFQFVTNGLILGIERHILSFGNRLLH